MKPTNKSFYWSFLLSLFTLSLSAQQPRELRLTLDETITLARRQSVNAAVALNELKTAYWEYRSYKADLLPEMSLSGTIPAYNKRYSTYQREDGSYSYVRNDFMQIDGSLSIKQNIWLTGGTLSINSSLNFMRQMTGGDPDNRNQYMSVPVALSLNQPIFGVNASKWNRRIEPIRYKEAKANFLTATENVAMSAINHFFNLMLAKERVSIARQNLDNAKKLYEVAKAKREMGQISENDLLQMRLNLLNEESSLTANESSLKSNMFALRSFLSIDEDVDIVPILPDSVPEVSIKYEDVLDHALRNNAFASSIRRRQLQADYSVAMAKGNLRQVTLHAQVGFTGSSQQTLRTAYDNLKDNQIVQVGVSIPLVDWGKRRGQVKVAESNREVTKSRLRQETANFHQDLFILTEQFNNQSRQLNIAREADKIAEKRYRTNVETFMIGKISTLDLNDAQTSKDQARQNRISELYSYWYYYYQLRSITLWDFVNNCDINEDIERIVKE